MLLERPPTGLKGLFGSGGWLDRVWEKIRSLEISRSSDLLVSKRTTGTSLKPRGGGIGKPGEDAQIQFRGQWDPETSYVEGDRVIDGDESADGKVAHDDGTWAGTWICIADVAGDPGNDHPADDAVSWQMEANGKHARRVYRVGDQQIILDAGRDATGNLWLKIHKNSGSVGTADILLDISAILTIATAEGYSAGEALIIKPRLTEGRDESTGDCKKAIFLRGEWQAV